jgi:glycosyltransferase involved in cell wall biosynthesis
MPSLLVVIPALNEAKTIQDVIGKIPRNLGGITDTRILVVDDGSTDQTAELATAVGAEVVSHPQNFGVGAAIQSGLAYAVEQGFDIAVNIDADGQFDPADIARLVAPIQGGMADFVSASRFKDPALVPKMPWIKHWGNQAMSRIISGLARQKYYDVSCGFRAYSKEALFRLILRGEFTYTQEMFLILSFKRLRIKEIPVKVRGEREHGKSRVASNLLTYAAKTSTIILRCFRDYKPGVFFNTLSGVIFAVAFFLGVFFFGHRFIAGTFSPHIWSGFLSGFFFTISFVVFLFGQIASMMDRERFYLEELIYQFRKKQHP